MTDGSQLPVGFRKDVIIILRWIVVSCSSRLHICNIRMHLLNAYNVCLSPTSPAFVYANNSYIFFFTKLLCKSKCKQLQSLGDI